MSSAAHKVIFTPSGIRASAQDGTSVFDVALAAGVAHLKSLPERPKPRALVEMALAWSPYRSLAARLLWHHWRHATGRPAGEAP